MTRQRERLIFNLVSYADVVSVRVALGMNAGTLVTCESLLYRNPH